MDKVENPVALFNRSVITEGTKEQIMIIKIKLTVTGSTPPNRTRQLISPKTIELDVAEKNVNKIVSVLEGWIKTLENMKGLLKF